MPISSVAKENVRGIIFSCLLIKRELQHLSLALLFVCWEPTVFLSECEIIVHAQLLKENRDKSQVFQSSLVKIICIV